MVGHSPGPPEAAMRASLILVPILLAAVPPPSAAPSPDRLAASGQSQDLRISTDDNGRMTVPVMVGGRGPYRFLVDTGAERTVVSLELADHLKLIAGTRATMHSVLGQSDVATVDIPALQVSNRSTAVAGAPTLLSDNIGADGILGVDMLRAQRVELDFKRKIMGISPSATRESRDGEEIIVVARRKHGRLLFTDATVDGRGVVVVIDTGSEYSIGNEALRAKLSRGRGVPLTAEIVTVAGEKAQAEIVVARELQIGGVTLKKIGIAFMPASVFRQLDLDKRPALLLGMNAMRAFDRVSIDFANSKVRFVMPGTSMASETRLAMR